jgi:hypothetical protein
MENTLSYCGLVCQSCPIHLATLEHDLERQLTMRADIAEQCNKLYGTALKAYDVNDCDGCKAPTGVLFSGCRNCKIRICARQKSIDNCACCESYACEKLKEHFQLDPEAKNRLDEFHNAYMKNGSL